MINNFREELESPDTKSNLNSKLPGSKSLNNEILNKIVEENESEGSQKSKDDASSESLHNSKQDGDGGVQKAGPGKISESAQNKEQNMQNLFHKFGLEDNDVGQ